MKKNEKLLIFGAILLAVVLGAGIYFNVYGIVFGDLTSGKQIIQVCEQTVAVGQSKDVYSCLQSYNSYADSVGDLYITGLTNYQNAKIPALTSIDCYTDAESKTWIRVKSGSKTWFNFVNQPGMRNVYDNNFAMTTLGIGGKTVYIRWDGCAGETTPKTCDDQTWTNCISATRSNIKVWIPYGAQTSVKCLPGWTDTQECWDGSTITTMQCVDYQKVSTHNDCPEEPETPPTSGGGTGTTPPTPCSPSSTLANAVWSTTTCSWTCNSGYQMVGGVCQVISGGTTTSPPVTPPVEDMTWLWFIAIVLLLGVAGLGYYVLKMKR